ncbi:MAG: hypothetical protein COV35_09520 [Alphaproteobacteria bacterium CG11_big_fil_rev_8_21_14_0_20_39_49]|nr:MAG: hypothetical protein COV35_09520 [Alphaproteobacteria bacterium CG11_big_fil_rev_8_21_14_0_20_39_49]
MTNSGKYVFILSSADSLHLNKFTNETKKKITDNIKDITPNPSDEERLLKILSPSIVFFESTATK